MSFSYDSSNITQDPIYDYPESSLDSTYGSHQFASGYITGSYAVSNTSDVDTTQLWDDIEPINNCDVFNEAHGYENDINIATSTVYTGTQPYQPTTDLEFYDASYDGATELDTGYQQDNADGLLNHNWNTQGRVLANNSSPPESPRETVQSFNNAALKHMPSNLQQVRPPLNRGAAYENYYALEDGQNTYAGSSSTFENSDFQQIAIQQYEYSKQITPDGSQDYPILENFYYSNNYLAPEASVLDASSRASSIYEPDSPPSNPSVPPTPTETTKSLKRRSRGKPGVSYLCPHEICSRNRNSESQGFDRHDNLLAHLRQVHKESIPRQPAGRPKKARNGD